MVGSRRIISARGIGGRLVSTSSTVVESEDEDMKKTVNWLFTFSGSWLSGFFVSYKGCLTYSKKVWPLPYYHPKTNLLSTVETVLTVRCM